MTASFSDARKRYTASIARRVQGRGPAAESAGVGVFGGGEADGFLVAVAMTGHLAGRDRFLRCYGWGGSGQARRLVTPRPPSSDVDPRPSSYGRQVSRVCTMIVITPAPLGKGSSE